MAFDYDRLKEKAEQSGNQWTSYSDLFMVLSVVFLLLYVIASLRNGTNSIQKNIEYQQLTQEIDDLQQQLRVYNNLKDGAIQNSITEKEQKDYKLLMGQLTLLQNEANEEKDELRKKAKENEQKENALNQYQQMIRNIINANVIAKSRIDRRDKIIVKKDLTIQDTRTELAAKKKLIKETNQQVSSLEQTLEAKKQIIVQNNQKVELIKENLNSKIDNLKKAYADKNISIKNAKRKIAQLKTESAERINNLEAQNVLYDKQLSRINTNLTKAQTKIIAANQEIQKREEKARRLAAAVEVEKGKSKQLSKDLKKAKAEIEDRRRIARTIERNLKKAGVNVLVDKKTGDVILTFGNEYFDTGKWFLKKNMKNILRKFMPIYAKSLLANKKVAKKIDAVEVIGFASPTYRGRFVDPRSMTLKDKAAVNYNLDLSYKRARSIFDYVFFTKGFKFKYQKTLSPMIKVTGRSFLTEKITGRNVATDQVANQYCATYNCKASQRVIIKFTLKQ